MKIGDLISYGTMGHWHLKGCLGILLRKLQYDNDDDEALNWDGEPAWWVHFANDKAPMWAYEEELTPVTKGN